MQILYSLFISIILFCFFSISVFARSGCCSHHGGVCGCGCCDGSPLSSTCAPYYPECSGGGQSTESLPINTPPTNTPIPWPTWTPTPTPTEIPTLTPSLTPTVTPTSFQVKQSITTKPVPTVVVAGTTEQSNSLGGVITLLLIGAGGYWLYKRRKQNSNK